MPLLFTSQPHAANSTQTTRYALNNSSSTSTSTNSNAKLNGNTSVATRSLLNRKSKSTGKLISHSPHHVGFADSPNLTPTGGGMSSNIHPSSLGYV